MRYYIHGGQAFCAGSIATLEQKYGVSERHEGCEREVFFADNPDLNSQDLLYFISSTPMFATSRVAIVKGVRSNPKLFRAVLNSPANDDVHIIAVDVLDTQPKKKATKAKPKSASGGAKAGAKVKTPTSFPQMRTIEKAGFTVWGEEVFNRFTGPNHIIQFVYEKFGMNLNLNDARGVFDSYDQNMSLIINDFNNILLYMGRIDDRSPNNISATLRQAKPRTAKDLLKYLPFYKTTNIFPLLDAFAVQNKGASERILHSILQSNMNDATLIALFNSLFRQVKHIYGLQLHPEMVADKKTLPPFALKKLRDSGAVRKWSVPQMTLFFHEMSKLDLKQKTGLISPQNALIAVVEMLPYNQQNRMQVYEI